jgi:hypothetical protein
MKPASRSTRGIKTRIFSERRPDWSPAGRVGTWSAARCSELGLEPLSRNRERIVSPSGRQSRVIWPPNCRKPLSETTRRRSPARPSAASQLDRHVRSSEPQRSSSANTTSIDPVSAERESYFAAFVANSCSSKRSCGDDGAGNGAVNSRDGDARMLGIIKRRDNRADQGVERRRRRGAVDAISRK